MTSLTKSLKAKEPDTTSYQLHFIPQILGGLLPSSIIAT
jgi:hypothetical protein